MCSTSKTMMSNLDHLAQTEMPMLPRNSEFATQYSVRNACVQIQDGQIEATGTLFRLTREVARITLVKGQAMIEYEFADPNEETRFLRCVLALPKHAFRESIRDRNTAVALVLLDLLDQAWIGKWLRRECRGATLFRLRSDAMGIWRELEVPFTSQVGEEIRRTFGTELAEIANETYPIRARKSKTTALEILHA